METKVLKPEYQALNDKFNHKYSDRGCTCFISPPCGYCTHEGNPLNLEGTDDAWESELIAEVRWAVENQGVLRGK